MKSCTLHELAERCAEPLPALTTSVDALAAKVASRLAMLDLPDIMDAAANHADDFNQQDFDEGMPGGSGACVTIHVKDRDAFLRKFADELRPLCKELEPES